MGVATLSTLPVKLNGQRLRILADPNEAEFEDTPGYNETWVAQTADKPLVQGDVPLYIRRFTKGAGFMERRDADDDGGYAWAEDGFTHLEAGFMPSGRRVAKGAGLGLGITGVAIVDSRVFDDDLWCLTTGGVLIRIPNCDPTQTPVIDPALNAFGSATASFRSGYAAKAIEVFETRVNAGTGDYDAGGTKVAALYVSTRHSGGDTRIYEYVPGRAGDDWRESSVLGFRADRMATNWWEGLDDGVGANRLHIQADDNTIRHCIAGSNPLDPASYVTPIEIGSAAHPIVRLQAAPARLYVRKTDGWYDVNEFRTGNITPYYAEAPDPVDVTAATIYDDGLYAARKFGVDRLDLRLGELVQQRIPGECGPGFKWQDGSPVVGQVTGFAQHDGYLLIPLWNAETQTSYVGRAKPREAVGVNVQNPMVHYWAEQVIKPTGGTGQQITHLKVVSTTVAAGLSAVARTTYLLMFTADNPFSAGSNFNLYYAPLPQGSGPLSMQVTGSTFTFNPQAALFMTAQQWGDRNAAKHVLRYDSDAQLVSATKTITILSRPDGDPTTILTPATWKTEGTITTNSGTITPATATTAHILGLQAILVVPSPYTSAPILRELSPRARVARELLAKRTLWVLCERNHGMQQGGTPDLRAPDVVYDAITAIQSVAPVEYIDELGRTYDVLVEQGIAAYRVRVGGGQFRTVARVALRIVGSG